MSNQWDTYATIYNEGIGSNSLKTTLTLSPHIFILIR